MPDPWSPGVREKLQAGPTRFIRARRGAVHRWGCRHAGKWWVGWQWAEDRSWDEIAALPWVKACAHCRPGSNQESDSEESNRD